MTGGRVGNVSAGRFRLLLFCDAFDGVGEGAVTGVFPDLRKDMLWTFCR